MIVDTSALIAIAWDEPERARFEDAIEADPVPPMPAADIGAPRARKHSRAAIA